MIRGVTLVKDLVGGRVSPMMYVGLPVSNALQEGFEAVITEVINDHYPYTNFQEYMVDQLRCRARKFLEPRMLFYYFCKEYNNTPGYTLGKRFNVSHATIIHSTKVMKNLCETDRDFRKKFNEMDGILSYAKKVFDEKNRVKHVGKAKKEA